MKLTSAQSGQGGVYRGWQVLAGAFASSILIVGGTLYIFGLLVAPLSREFGLSRADVNTGLIAAIVGIALWSPFVGQLIDRVSIRILMPLGALLTAAGVAVIAISHSPVVMMAGAAVLLGFGISAAGTLAGNAVVARWFHRRRGRALGLMSVSTSVGGVLIPPVAALLIERFGWRPALLMIAVVIGVGASLLGFFAMRDRPSEGELLAAGETEVADTGPAAAAADQAEPQVTMGAILRNRDFWLILLGAGLLLAIDQVLVATNIPFFQGQGVALAAASILVAVQSGAAIVGKLLVGFLAERVDIRRLFAGVGALHAVLMMFYIFWPGYWPMLLIIAVIGVAVGGSLPLWGLLVAASFRSQDFGKASGAMGPGMQILSIVFVRLSGEAFDRTGSYQLAMWCFAGAALVAVGLIATTRLGGGSAPKS
jgi:sugar phosphate permease